MWKIQNFGKKDYDSLTNGDGRELLASVIFNFATCIVSSARLRKLADWGVVACCSWLTVCNIAFLLVTRLSTLGGPVLR